MSTELDPFAALGSGEVGREGISDENISTFRKAWRHSSVIQVIFCLLYVLNDGDVITIAYAYGKLAILVNINHL